MPHEWHAQRRDGKVVGPISSSRLRAEAAAGYLDDTSLVRRDDREDWVAAGNVRGLEFGVPQAPPNAGAAIHAHRTEDARRRRRYRSLVSVVSRIYLTLCLLPTAVTLTLSLVEILSAPFRSELTISDAVGAVPVAFLAGLPISFLVLLVLLPFYLAIVFWTAVFRVARGD